jgi:hypothetical protein
MGKIEVKIEHKIQSFHGLKKTLNKLGTEENHPS